VIDWLLYCGVPFIRINEEDKITNINIVINDILFDIEVTFFVKLIKKGIKVNSKQIEGYWYRRGKLNYDIEIGEVNKVFSQLKKNLELDKDSVVELIHTLLTTQSRSLGSYYKEARKNKFLDLLMAKKVGLKIPKTVLSGSKKYIKKNYESLKRALITKNIRYPINITTENIRIGDPGTVVIGSKDINVWKENFLPAKFQEKLEKLYELRIFFIKDKLFSMAIFSQKDEQTRVDFRNYNMSSPNRMIPYVLPLEIEDKIKQFIVNSELDSGSIDIVVTPNDEFIFLEVNPAGQFGFVSFSCNYYLEKHIAEFFTNLDDSFF